MEKKEDKQSPGFPGSSASGGELRKIIQFSKFRATLPTLFRHQNHPEEQIFTSRVFNVNKEESESTPFPRSRTYKIRISPQTSSIHPCLS